MRRNSRLFDSRTMPRRPAEHYRQPVGLEDSPFVSRRVCNVLDFITDAEAAQVTVLGNPAIAYRNPGSPIGTVEITLRENENGTMQVRTCPIRLETGVAVHCLMHVKVSQDSAAAWSAGFGNYDEEVTTPTGIMLVSAAGTRKVRLYVAGADTGIEITNPNTENAYMALEFYIEMCTCRSGKGVIKVKLNNIVVADAEFLTIPSSAELYAVLGVTDAPTGTTDIKMDYIGWQMTRFSQTQIATVSGAVADGGGSSGGGGGDSSCGGLLNPFCEGTPVE